MMLGSKFDRRENSRVKTFRFSKKAEMMVCWFTDTMREPNQYKMVVFAPHPDDLSISMGALAAFLAGQGVQITPVLATDGSESAIPENVLREHGWAGGEQMSLRGRIRVQEAYEEARRLGLGKVVLLKHQEWFNRHRTPPALLRRDCSLNAVEDFIPGPVTPAALEEIGCLVQGMDVCAVPDPNDRLLMHRIVTQMVCEVRCEVPVMTYKCLSTVVTSGPQFLFEFRQELMDVKCHALRAHRSMFERRRQFGGYSNPGSEGYDNLVTRADRELARAHRSSMPYAESYGWIQ